jgi:hypothetical protein
MVSQSTYDELATKYRELSAQLEANPLYRELQAFKHLLDMYGREQTDTATHSSWKEQTLITTAEDREAMVNAAERHMVIIKNISITMKKLAAEVQNLGISIKGKYAGTALGATLSARKEWKLVDKKRRLWQMTDDAFAVAQARYQFNGTTTVRPSAVWLN